MGPRDILWWGYGASIWKKDGKVEMAKKKPEASKVRYLNELNPKIARHVPGLEELVQSLSQRLSKLKGNCKII